MGKAQVVNSMANKILKRQFEERGIFTCEANMEGCWRVNNLKPHHRKRRIEYHNSRDIKQWVRNLSDFNESILVCPVCHDKLEPGSELSEDFFKRLRG